MILPAAHIMHRNSPVTQMLTGCVASGNGGDGLWIPVVTENGVLSCCEHIGQRSLDTGYFRMDF